MPNERIRALEQWTHADCQPDLTLLFDVPAGVSRARLDSRRSSPGARSTSSSGRRRRFSRACATPTSSAPPQLPQRIRVIDSTRPLEVVRAEVAAHLDGAGTCPHDERTARREAARPSLVAAVAVAGRRGALGARASARRWPHALLIHGPRGIGKHALALNFAQALLCESPRADGLACGECAGCRYAVAGQHPDLMRLELLVIDPEEDTLEVGGHHRASTAIRALTEFVQLTSHRQRAKVAVIAPAERMNAAAANALLKTLEEPPPGTYLILVSDRARARCRRRCARVAASSRRRCRHATEARAWLAAQGVAAPGLSRLPRRRARRCARSRMRRSGACRSERRAWLAALGAPERLSVPALAARIDAGGKDERRARLAHALEWLIAWTADLARVAAGDAVRLNPDAAAPLRAARDAGGARRVVSLSSVVAAAARDAGASAATAPRRRGDAAGLPGPVLTMAENKPISAVPGAAMAAAGARPGVLSLNIRERAALYAAYMPFLKGGGIFIPTSRQYQLGEEVFMLLSLMDDPNRIAVQGKVVWITPEGVQGNRTQGIGVQFTQDETGATARATIEQILGETLGSVRPTHTM